MADGAKNQSKKIPDERLYLTEKTAPSSFESGAPSSKSLVRYVLVELHVERKKHDAFKAAMPELVDLMFSHHRWELVYAAYPVTGKIDRFIHIWKVPDESSLLEIMLEGGLSKDMLKSANPAVKGFNAVYERVQDLIEDTKHRLMTSLPYDPNQVGFQSQSLLVDQANALFVIDHERLRGRALDISDRLGEVREKASPHGKLSGRQLAKGTTFEDRLVQLLSRGATTATMQLESELAL